MEKYNKVSGKKMSQPTRFRMWKSGKKWLVASTVILTVAFGPTNIVGAVEVVSSSISENQTTSEIQDSSDANVNPSTEDSKTSSQESSTQSTTQSTTKDKTSEVSTSEEDPSSSTTVTPKMSGLTLDMDTTSPTAEDSIGYNLTADGNGWPTSKENARQLSISATVAKGDVIKITLPKGLAVATKDVPSIATETEKTVGGSIELTYTFDKGSGVTSFNISYYFVAMGDNQQFAPGKTELPVTVEGGGTTLNGKINVTNPIDNTLTVRTHNTAVSNNTYTADGNSVYNFVMGVKTAPDFTASSAGITQAIHAKMSGVIHVPAGFVLKGASLAKYEDTQNNEPSDGSAVPGIPSGLTQPGGAGTDIIVDNVVGAGYLGENECFMYLYGYFATGTPDGTYHFTPDLTLTPQYYDGTMGSAKVTTGSLADIKLGTANPGVMTPMYGGVLEGSDKTGTDIDHEGFYSKTISTKTGATGFVTGKIEDTEINKDVATPNLGVKFEDTTVNQTNKLKDYKFTLPKNWCGNLEDVSFSTGPYESVVTSGNLNDVGPFTVILDNGHTFNVSTIKSNDAAITAELKSGAHIVSIAGQAEILAGNNLEGRLLNAVIEDGTYKNQDEVPMTLDVHSVTSDTDTTVTGHLYYFDDNVVSKSEFSIKGNLNYNISGTYSQGQEFTTGSKWTTLNKETALDGDTTGKIIIPGSATKDSTADVVLPTFVVSSFDKGSVDIDQSKIANWGWTYDGKKYYPEIKDLGTDPTTGEHLTELDFSKIKLTIPANINPGFAFFYPDALPWKVSDIAAPATGTTTQWITKLTDNNKDALHPIYGGKEYIGSTGMKWTITAPASIQGSVGLAGSRTGSTTFYDETTGMAGFDRGLKEDKSDDDNSGSVMLSITNGSKNTYTNAQTITVLPRISDGDALTMNMTGPVTGLKGTGAEVVYSTKPYDLPVEGSDKAVDLTTSDWVDESKVTDWSTVRSIAIKSDSLSSMDVLAGYVPVEIDQISKTTIGDTSEVQSYSYAKGTASGSDLTVNQPMKAQIYGIPQIKVHYEETVDGKTSNGNVLEKVETLTGKDTNGTDPAYEKYTAEKKTVTGYTFKAMADGSAPETATLTDTTKDVTYLYTKDPVKAGNVIAKYVDEKDKELLPAVTKEGNVGEDYSTKKEAIPGYTFKEMAKGSAPVSGQFKVEEQTVTYVYKADTQKLVYNVIDDTTGKTLEDKVDFDSGKSGSDINKKQKDLQAIADGYKAKGYTEVSVDKLPGQFDNDSSKDQVVNIHLKHGTTIETENKAVKQVIHYIYEDKSEAAKDHKAQVDFSREVTKDAVTGAVIKTGDWSTKKDSFDKVVSPIISGYTADKAEIAQVEHVTADDKDQELTVVYKADTQKLVYNVIDDTTGKTLEDKVDFDSGKSGSDINKTQDDLQAIADGYKAKGYTVVSVDDLPGQFDNDSSKDQVVNIHLKHGTTIETENKAVKQVIHYIYEDKSEAAKDHKAQVDFSREVTKDAVTGEVIKTGDWSTKKDSFDKVVSPIISGYTADKAEIAQVEHVTADDKDQELTVVYKADTQKLVYNVIDDTTTKTLEDKVDFDSGKSGSDINKTQDDLQVIADGYKAKGYTVVSVDDLPGQFDNDSSKDQVVNIHLKHGTTIETENKAVKQVIHYIYEDKSEAAKDHKAQVDFSREVTKDAVTGAVIKTGDWSTKKDSFDKVVSPIISGYTADKAEIAQVEHVTADDKDQELTVIYKAPVKAADVTAKYVDDKGNTISDDVIKHGNLGENYSTDKKTIKGYTFKEMAKDSAAVSGAFTNKAQTVTYVYTKNENPTPTPDLTPSNDMKPDNKGNDSKDSLPSTGENANLSLYATMLGLITMALTSIAVFFKSKKK